MSYKLDILPAFSSEACAYIAQIFVAEIMRAWFAMGTS